MWKGIKELLGQKKFLAALLSAVAWGVGKFGLKVDADELLPLVAPLWGYILGQSVADFGKSVKQIEAAKPTTPAS